MLEKQNLKKLLDEAIPRFPTHHPAIAIGCHIWNTDPNSISGRLKARIRAYITSCLANDKDLDIETIKDFHSRQRSGGSAPRKTTLAE